MKIKNMFLSFIIICSMIIGLPFVSYAAESVDGNGQDNIKLSNTTQPLSDFSFIKSSTIKTFKENGGGYNITITDTPSQNQNSRDMEEFSTQSISFFSLQEKEKDKILEYVSDVKNSSIATCSGGSKSATTTPLLGAGFTVTAKRPSGTKKTYTVNANIINN